MADALPTSRAGGLRRSPRAANALTSTAGSGSIATTSCGARPSASQPSSIAPPILPAPTSTMVPDRSPSDCAPRAADAGVLMATLASVPRCNRSEAWKRGYRKLAEMNCGRPSGLAGGLEHRGIKRVARRLAGPHHELERRIIALAGIKRGREQRLALPARRFDAAGKNQGGPVHHQAGLNPEIGMPDPHLLVDHRGELPNVVARALRRLELERAADMQRLDLVHP